MFSSEYKVFFDGTSASREQLERVESIRIEQAIDMAWEASIEMNLLMNDSGEWSGHDEEYQQPFARVRIGKSVV